MTDTTITSSRDSSTDLLNEITVTIHGREGIECEPVDYITALHTTLCFLCSVNVEATTVERFLSSHPQALLLEREKHVPNGVCQRSNKRAEEIDQNHAESDSVRLILYKCMRKCRCLHVACNRNRARLLHLIDTGFEYFHQKQLSSRYTDHVIGETANSDNNEARNYFASRSEHSNLFFYSKELTKLEMDIRLLRHEIYVLNCRLLEDLKQQNEKTHRHNQSSSDNRKSERRSFRVSFLFSTSVFCRGRKQTPQRLHITPDATVKSANEALQEDFRAISFTIRRIRQLQFDLLKTAFTGAERHVCLSRGVKPRHSDVLAPCKKA